MRYIPLRKQAPDPVWLEKAHRLLQALERAPDNEARNAIIDSNTHVWGELKQWLLKISYQKCWFSEAKDCFSHWDVEHYRPKKSVRQSDGSSSEGYWWLAFDWTNFRICGNAGNRKKGTYFPLREGSRRANGPLDDLRYEDPQLLDPIDEDDPALLSFDFEGRAVPGIHVTDAWEQDRVNYSVERYNLNFPQLMDKRRIVWQDCWQRIQLYLEELARYQRDKSNVIAKEASKAAMRHLRELIHPEQELSGVARACILSTGDDRLRAVLGTS